MSVCWLAAELDWSARRQVRAQDQRHQQAADDGQHYPQDQQPEAVAAAAGLGRSGGGRGVGGHQACTSIWPIM